MQFHRHILLVLFFPTMLWAEVHYSPSMLPNIISDIYEDLLEQERNVDLEQLTEDLIALHENPINLNTATAEDLRQIPFLSEDQIDNILLFVYHQPLHNLYELQLVAGLHDWEIRNLLPFVFVDEYEKKESFYWHEMWHYARHEINLRFDARSIENNRPDPFYASIKYGFNYKNKVEFGLTLERDPGEPLYYAHKTYGADFYGGYLQVQNVWRFKRIVVGDFRACYGQGLVVNTNMHYGGKAAVLSGAGFVREGLQRKTSTAEYDFLRGTGATLSLGRWDISAFYSARKVDGRSDGNSFPSIQTTGYHRTDSELDAKRSVWQQVVGFNTTLRLKHARIGLTAVENLLGDTLMPRTTYYNHNYFCGNRQFAAGLNYQWHLRRLMLFGEVATAQNIKWGIANITGLRISASADVSFTALYRYYSPHYDNLLANAFGETSRQNDENGLFVGADITALKHWRFSAYTDVFYFSGFKYGIRASHTWGGDTWLQAEYHPSELLSMQWRTRVKIKGGKQKYSLRYTLSSQTGNWIFRTTLEGNLQTDSLNRALTPNFGGVAAQQIEYHFPQVPLVLQGRIEAFYTATYDNRFYLYENDVLYAFSIPMLYGRGGRWFFNFRYQINNHVALYLKAAQTIYSPSWIEEQSLPAATRTEIHTLLRIKI